MTPTTKRIPWQEWKEALRKQMDLFDFPIGDNYDEDAFMDMWADDLTPYEAMVEEIYAGL